MSKFIGNDLIANGPDPLTNPPWPEPAVTT
jgi:hypothetical protein